MPFPDCPRLAGDNVSRPVAPTSGDPSPADARTRWMSYRTRRSILRPHATSRQYNPVNCEGKNYFSRIRKNYRQFSHGIVKSRVLELHAIPPTSRSSVQSSAERSCSINSPPSSRAKPTANRLQKRNADSPRKIRSARRRKDDKKNAFSYAFRVLRGSF
jgi:hypothetical protein